MNDDQHKTKFYKWVVEIEVSDNWVADGFNLDNDRLHSMLWEALPYAYGGELKARVVSAPNPDLIRQEQGYTTDENGKPYPQTEGVS